MKWFKLLTQNEIYGYSFNFNLRDCLVLGNFQNRESVDLQVYLTVYVCLNSLKEKAFKKKDSAKDDLKLNLWIYSERSLEVFLTVYCITKSHRREISISFHQDFHLCLSNVHWQCGSYSQKWLVLLLTKALILEHTECSQKGALWFLRKHLTLHKK